MTEKVDQARALQILREEVARAEVDADPEWERYVDRLSKVCEGGSRTFIAFLGTALLAKATNIRIDPFAVKSRAGTSGAYSARSLAQHVLAAHAPELEIDIGVTGREPLNNQPFFRIDAVSRDETKKIVLPGARAAVDILCDALERLEQVRDENEARSALRSFIKMRRRRKAQYELTLQDGGSLNLGGFIEFTKSFVARSSEGGRRAQAVAAGIMDVVAGEDRVATDRINDPDRHVPGDIAIRANDGARWERIFEVRDKAVAGTDLFHLVGKAERSGVTKAAMIAVATAQGALSIHEASRWAEKHGVELTVFIGWEELVRQAVWWSNLTPTEFIKAAYVSIHTRLIALEVSESGVRNWTERAILESH